MKTLTTQSPEGQVHDMMKLAIKITDETMEQPGFHKKNPQVLASVLNAIATSHLKDEVQALRQDITSAITDGLVTALRASKED